MKDNLEIAEFNEIKPGMICRCGDLEFPVLKHGVDNWTVPIGNMYFYKGNKPIFDALGFVFYKESIREIPYDENTAWCLVEDYEILPGDIANLMPSVYVEEIKSNGFINLNSQLNPIHVSLFKTLGVKFYRKKEKKQLDQMSWTHNPPNKSGWYWMLEPYQLEPEIAKVDYCDVTKQFLYKKNDINTAVKFTNNLWCYVPNPINYID